MGYSTTLKKDAQDMDHKQLVRKGFKLGIVLFLIGSIGYVIIVNIRAYNKYGYYVYVLDENMFLSKIDPKNPKIIDHGRMQKRKIISIDDEIDRGDGQKKRKIRWYGCYGIDCDEGWQIRFYK